MNLKSILSIPHKSVVAPTTKETAGGATNAKALGRLQALNEYLGDLKPGQHAGRPLLLKGVKLENGKVIRTQNARVSAHKQGWLSSKFDKLRGRVDGDKRRAAAFTEDFTGLAESLLAKTRYADTNVSSAARAFLNVLASGEARVTESLREAVNNLVVALEDPKSNAGTPTVNRPRTEAVSTPKLLSENATVDKSPATTETPLNPQAYDLARTLENAHGDSVNARSIGNPDGQLRLAVAAMMRDLSNTELKEAVLRRLPAAVRHAVETELAEIEGQFRPSSHAAINLLPLATMSDMDRATEIGKMTKDEKEAHDIDPVLDDLCKAKAEEINQAMAQAQGKEGGARDDGTVAAFNLGAAMARNYGRNDVLNTGMLAYLTEDARAAFLMGLGRG